MNTVALKPRTIDVSAFDKSKRLGAWADALNENWYALDLTDPAQTFENGRFGFFDIPGIRFGAIDSDAMNVFRRREHLSHPGGDYYFLPIPMRDTVALRQAGREAALDPGDLTVIATADTYQYQQETPNSLITLRVEGPMMRDRIPMIDDLVAQPCDGRAPLVRVFVDFAHSLIRQRDELDGDSAAAMAPHLLDLLALALTVPVDALKSNESSVRLAHLRRIMRAIENRLDDEALGPGSLAMELGLSERYIQKMFAERGETLSGVIRARRIATAQRRLLDPTRRGLSIASIAFSVGFSDPAHFSRAFRNVTGLSPSEYRTDRQMES